MFSLIFTETYLRKESIFLKKHPEITGRYKKVLRLLELQPNHAFLRLHKLKGKFQGKYAISVTLSYRIILTFALKGNDIILIDIGSHDEVY